MQPPLALPEPVHKCPPKDRVFCLTFASFKSALVLKLICLGLTCLSQAVAQSTGIFSATGEMQSTRFYHTASRLADGRVLVVGGRSHLNETLSSAELYDPDKGEFIRTGNMLSPRRAHTATVLANGKVLVAGGYGPNESLATAELYDPASGTFAPTGGMSTAQGWPAATLLYNGKVLIAGGLVATGFVLPGRAELYDPHSGTFSAVPLNQRLYWPTATLLSDGTVLNAVGRSLEFVGSVGVVGTYDRYYALVRISFDTSLLFDPIANTFAAIGEVPSYTTYWHTATLLKNGMVLVVGGGDADEGHRSASASLFDPTTRTFHEINSTDRPRMSHTATLLNDGTVLIAGGGDASSELYDPSARKFSSNAEMREARIGHTATLLNDGRVLVAGGGSKSAEIYRPLLLIPSATVSDFRFDRTEVVAGTAYTAIISGSNLTAETFFDARFSVGTETYVVLNWQRGLTINHSVPADAIAGSWTVTGVRPHKEEGDHTGDFSLLNVTIEIVR